MNEKEQEKYKKFLLETDIHLLRYEIIVNMYAMIDLIPKLIEQIKKGKDGAMIDYKAFVLKYLPKCYNDLEYMKEAYAKLKERHGDNKGVEDVERRKDN